ncbi:MAG: adenylyltransferase/cytidyltransferase family protein [Chlamydiota bacterium]
MNRWTEVKYISPDKLEGKVLELRNARQTIATLNGSFDLLHVGHLRIIHEASEQADSLILALNSDASIKKYKGRLRPILPLEDRLEMVAALEFVDYVTEFDEIDPVALLEKIKPDVHNNGSDYGENCIEAEVVKKYGGKIHIIELIPGFSSSKLIETIKTCS